MQPLLNVKYDTITIIHLILGGMLSANFFSDARQGEGESPPLWPLQEMRSPPLLPCYIREDTWSLHNRWHTSNIITIAN